MLNTSLLLTLPILLQTCCKHFLLNRPNNWTIIAIHSQKMTVQTQKKYPRIWNGDEDTWPNLLSSRLLAYYQYQIAALSKLSRIFSNFHKKEENAELDNLGRCKHNLLMHIWPGNSLYLYLCLYLHLFAGYTFSWPPKTINNRKVDVCRGPFVEFQDMS